MMTAALPRGKEAVARSSKRKWDVRVPVENLDARNGEWNPIARLSPRLKLMMILLDGHCGMQCYTWVGNEKLAAEYGCTERTVKDLLAELERAGLVERVITDGPPPGFTVRAGIILRQRVDHRLPKADTEDALRTARAALKEGREARREAARTRRGSSPRADGKVPPAQGEDLRPQNITSLSFEKDASEKDAPTESLSVEFPERQRQRTDPSPGPVLPIPPAPAPKPAQSPPPLDTSPAIHQEPVELTPGQTAWLATLTADQRRVFDGMSARARTAMLLPHEHGVNHNEIIRRDQAEKLWPRTEPPPPRPIPETTSELLGQLTGAPPDWPQKAAELLARDFGTTMDRDLWGEFLKIARAVWVGAFPAATVVNAYRQGMAPEIRNRGAKFWAALKCLGWKDPVS